MITIRKGLTPDVVGRKVRISSAREGTVYVGRIGDIRVNSQVLVMGNGPFETIDVELDASRIRLSGDESLEILTEDPLGGRARG